MTTWTRRNFIHVMGGAAAVGLRAAEQADEIIFVSATRLATLIREKKVSAVEAVRAFIARIEKVNPKLNAVVQTCFERALQEAKQVDELQARGQTKGPLHGVPMTIKDSIDTAGVITTGGTVGRMNYVPGKDATVVARLRAAGAILLGKTNTPEFTLAGGGVAGVGTTANIIYGISHNPYDLTRSTSGSSGGAGAIVAAGGSSFDIGSDWGGSIRGPAHANGITGMKPTSGRVPRTGHIVDYGGVFDSWQQLGPLARRVEDLILILPLIVGPDFRDAGIIPVPWNDPNRVEVSKLRVAFYPENGIAETTQETKETVRRAARHMEEAGCRIKEDYPKDLVMEMEEVRSKLTRADGWTFVKRLADRWSTKATSATLVDRFKEEPLPTPELTELLEQQDDSRRKLLWWVKNYDVVLCPVAGKPAPPINLGAEASRRGPGLSYTGLYNSTGWPAAVVRAGTSPEGLPIGCKSSASPGVTTWCWLSADISSQKPEAGRNRRCNRKQHEWHTIKEGISRRLGVELNIPGDLASALRDEDLAAKAKEALVMELLREHYISQGKAAAKCDPSGGPLASRQKRQHEEIICLSKRSDYRICEHAAARDLLSARPRRLRQKPNPCSDPGYIEASWRVRAL